MIAKLFCIIQSIRFRLKNGIRNNVYIGLRSKIIGGPYIIWGKNIKVRPDSFIACNKNAKMTIGSECDFGNRFRCGCASEVRIGANCLFGPNVYISDADHKYDDIDKPIKNQGVVKFSGVFIGDDCWFGTNSVIVGSVTIGKHCIIGANSVVNRNFPDYCVIVGAPAKIVKRYDFSLKRWVKVP